MSSMDQVFVKAFSRRRLAESDGQPGSHAAHSDASPTATTPAQPAIDPDRPSGEIGSLQVDRSVAETAEVWVDGESGKDVIARADHASLEIPRPHVELPSESQADPSQHVHTAYAGAFADPSLIAASLPQEESFAQIGSWPDADDTDTRRDSSEASSESTLTETSDLFAEEPVVEMRIDPPVPASSPKQVPTPDVVATPDEVEDTQPVSASELNLPQTMTSEEAANESGATYVPFQAVWEVDVFDVPTPVADLFFEGALFQQIAERMSDAVSSGLRSVLVTSAKPGEGRSSVAIGMAMAAAASGIRVALVDADSESPSLADELRLELQYGWVDVIRRGLPIKEIAVQAVEDGVTLIPLMPPGVRPAATGFEMVQLIDLLTSNFELIILDGPTSLSNGLHQCAAKVDSAVIVRDVTRSDELAVCELSNRLQEAGVRGVGVVENFV